MLRTSLALVVGLLLTPALHAEVAPAPAVATEATTSTLTIVESPIAANCFGKSAQERAIDTVAVHYASAIYWFDEDLQTKVPAEGKAYAEKVGLTKENLAKHKYDWPLVKAVFQAYEVSSHYIIARDGTIVRLVADNDVAWHAGKSKMPTHGREKVNSFSIGIELTASHPDDDPTVKTLDDGYTAAQYESLNKLIADLCSWHPITAVVGHDEIAPGRKTDPGPLFQWDKVRTKDYKPLACLAKDAPKP